MSRALVLSVLIGVALGHVCILNPNQRGGPHTITAAADPWCKLTTGPCGGQAPEVGLIQYHRNDTVTIAWQKNQDHWAAATPGYFSVGFATGPSAPITELARIPDSATPSLTVYETQVVLDTPSPTAVISVEYFTGQGFTFFACADVVVN